MYKVIADTSKMTHDEWLDFRNTGIGGSDVAKICGLSKFGKLEDIWRQKINREFTESFQSEAAYWGNVLEPVVRNEMSSRLGLEIIKSDEILQSKLYSFMLANLDGIIDDPFLGKCIFEAKTSSYSRKKEWADNNIPKEYLLQIQHYMIVTGFKNCYIAVLIGGNCYRWQLIEYDSELAGLIIKVENEFWKCVVSQSNDFKLVREYSNKLVSYIGG
jgi:putative phage-type endonuclease